MFRRYPRLSSVVVGWLVASAVVVGRIAYLEATGWSSLVIAGGTQAVVPKPAWSSSVAWVDSTYFGWMAGGVAAGLCLNVLAVRQWLVPEPGSLDVREDEDDD